jgi:hypothetical protein
MTTMKAETFIQKKYDWHAAGRIWTFDKVTFTRAPDGSVGLSFAEIDRMNKLITNEICKSLAALTASEFEFFCDITATSFVTVAKMLHISKATVSLWAKKKSTLPFAESVLLKEYFWSTVFSVELAASTRYEPSVLPEDRLRQMAHYAEEHAFVQGGARPKAA